MTSVKQDFSTLLSLTTLSLIILCCGGCPVHWTVFNVISVLCPSDVSSTPSVATTRIVQTLPHMPQRTGRDRSAPIENHCYRLLRKLELGMGG